MLVWPANVLHAVIAAALLQQLLARTRVKRKFTNTWNLRLLFLSRDSNSQESLRHKNTYGTTGKVE
jgi:hypothetical protein